MRIFIPVFLLLVLTLASCSKSSTGRKVVMPKYHHSWYKDHVYKKKWRVGRIKFVTEKQGVKRVKLKG